MTDTPGNIPPSGPLPGHLRLYVLLIAGLTLAAYSPLLRSGFTNWDDQEMVVNNAAIRSLGIPEIVHIFGMTSIGHYHPLVLISYALDHALGGFDPHVFHASSLLLHLANILLVALFAWRLTANAVITGVTVTLFALHPLQVEPVAWISSRKDLLFSFWYLGGLLAYLRYRERPRRAWYFAALALALLSCLSKSMAVTFPVVLVLLDRYAGRSLRGPALYEKIPFFVISLLFGVLSIVTQSGAHAVRLGDSFSAVNQFFVGCHGIMFYLTRLFIPSGFSAFYPYPARSAGALPLEYLLSPLAVVALVLVVIRLSRHDARVWFGAGMALVMVLPVLQFLPVANAVAADRYAYLSMVGLGLTVGALWSDLLARIDGHRILRLGWTACSLLVVAATGFVSCGRCGVWYSAGTLWNDVLERSPDNPIALYNRAEAFQQAGDPQRALADYDRVIAIDPWKVEALNDRGNVLHMLGRYDEALRDYSAALARDAGMLKARMNRGNLERRLGRWEEAVGDLSAVIAADTTRGDAFAARASCEAALGRTTEARRDAGEAIRRGSEVRSMFVLRGRSAYAAGDALAAEADFTEALRLDPTDVQTIVFRAYAAAAAGDLRMAQQDIGDAQRRGYRFDPAFLHALASRRPHHP